MSDCLITRRGGGVPPSITYPIVAVLTESTTWTVPRSGTYWVTCIGSGGIGAIRTHVTPYTHTFCAGGGGAGGIAESEIQLMKETSVLITIDNGITSFGSYLSAASGEDAKVTNTGNYIGTGGTGGTGIGGNLGNYDGGNGESVPDDSDTLFIRGGDTNINARYGGGQGGEIFGKGIITTGICGCIMVPPNKKTSHGFFPFGAGQGKIDINYDGWTGNGVGYLYLFYGDSIPSIISELNGAVIIEQIK